MQKWSSELIAKARQMRSDSVPIKFISKTTGIPPSTVWKYVKDIKIPLAVQGSNESVLCLVTKARHAKQRALWNLEMNKRGEEIPPITGLPLFFLGLGLYWGDGTKNKARPISFANIDPNAIKAYINFLIEAGADRTKLSLSVVIHKDVDIDDVRKYWSKITGIPNKRIYLTLRDYQSTYIKQPQGTAHVNLQDASFSRKVFGWLEGLYRQFDSPAEKTI